MSASRTPARSKTRSPRAAVVPLPASRRRRSVTGQGRRPPGRARRPDRRLRARPLSVSQGRVRRDRDGDRRAASRSSASASAPSSSPRCSAPASIPAREKEIGWGLLGLTPDGRKSPLARSMRTSAGCCIGTATLSICRAARPGSPRPRSRRTRPSASTTARCSRCNSMWSSTRADMERWLIGHTLELTTSGIDLAQAPRRH